jgi:hypothetical protein
MFLGAILARLSSLASAGKGAGPPMLAQRAGVVKGLNRARSWQIRVGFVFTKLAARALRGGGFGSLCFVSFGFGSLRFCKNARSMGVVQSGSTRSAL